MRKWALIALLLVLPVTIRFQMRVQHTIWKHRTHIKSILHPSFAPAWFVTRIFMPIRDQVFHWIKYCGLLSRSQRVFGQSLKQKWHCQYTFSDFNHSSKTTLSSLNKGFPHFLSLLSPQINLRQTTWESLIKSQDELTNKNIPNSMLCKVIIQLSPTERWCIITKMLH